MCIMKFKEGDKDEHISKERKRMQNGMLYICKLAKLYRKRFREQHMRFWLAFGNMKFNYAIDTKHTHKQTHTYTYVHLNIDREHKRRAKRARKRFILGQSLVHNFSRLSSSPVCPACPLLTSCRASS